MDPSPRASFKVLQKAPLPLLIAIAWLLAAALVLTSLYWSVVHYRIHRDMGTDRSALRGVDRPEPDGGWPLVSIIIPAHNEELMIASCIESVLAQRYERFEAIIVCDRCTDRTVEIARGYEERDDRIRVIENEDCPDDWNGKCNAARVGADVATGDWLLFSDADTVFHPDLVRATTVLGIEQDVHLVTLLSTLTTRRPHEWIAQPVATYTLLQLRPMFRPAVGPRAVPFANGQYMLFRRDGYDLIDGHAGVKESLTEDLAFADRLANSGGRILTLFADGLLQCEMFESMPAFVSGWRRIYCGVCNHRMERLRRHGWRAILVGLGVPLIEILAIVHAIRLYRHDAVVLGTALLVATVITILIQYTALGRIYRRGRSPLWSVLLFPVGSWIIGRAMLRSAWHLRTGTPFHWGGRPYVIEPR